MKKIITSLALIFICKAGIAQIPNYTITSPQNFVITCGNPTVTVYASSLTAPGYTFSITAPGNYTLTAGSGTMAINIPLTINSNTFAPDLGVISTGSLLTCDTPSLQIQGYSNTANVSYLWTSNQGTVSGNPILLVNANYSLTPTVAPFNIYTLTLTDPTNQCKRDTVIPIYQNIFKPNAAISSTTSVFTCVIYSIQLNNTSSSAIPANSPFPNNQSVITYSWGGTGLTPLNPNIYPAYTAGNYTLTVRDPNNGCLSSTIKTIGDNKVYPVLSQAGPFSVSCPNGTAVIGSAFQGSTGNFSFVWSNAGSGIYIPSANSPTLFVNSPGFYQIVATNNQNGCSSQLVISVYACVGIDENQNAFTALSIFPNPVIEKININSDGLLPMNMSVTINNAIGERMFSTHHVDHRQEIDLSFLQSGIYFLRLENGIDTRVFRIIKQ